MHNKRHNIVNINGLYTDIIAKFMKVIDDIFYIYYLSTNISKKNLPILKIFDGKRTVFCTE